MTNAVLLKGAGVMQNIQVVRYSPDTSSAELTAQLVECYRNVFSDEPWNEWLKCPACGSYWGTKDRSLLASLDFQHCGVPIQDFWPRTQVIADLRHEITPQASCWIAMHGEMAVGFCWGYPITTHELEAKLAIPLSGINELVAYQDEVGVLYPYRGQKIAKAMIIKRLNDFLEQGLRTGIVRTRQKPTPSTTFLWYTEKLGYKILASYPGNDGRVVLGRSLDGLRELIAS